MKTLVDALKKTEYIKKLTISNTEASFNSVELLVSYVTSSKSLEYLDLSNNSFTDLYSLILSSLFESQLKILILEKNKFEDTVFSSELSNNIDLLHYSLSFNPLKYSSVISLLEALSENKTLQYLGLSGIQFKGAAPIKENSSGLLDAQEGIILKLSYVLRNSFLACICFDINPNCTIQLKELENTMIKYNKLLTCIESKFIE